MNNISTNNNECPPENATLTLLPELNPTSEQYLKTQRHNWHKENTKLLTFIADFGRKTYESVALNLELWLLVKVVSDNLLICTQVTSKKIIPVLTPKSWGLFCNSHAPKIMLCMFSVHYLWPETLAELCRSNVCIFSLKVREPVI